ncbi:MAG: hypothetical protein DLM70_13360 [Chloroflexi bacterium]|nr:MAG: hypothetical protein DLM70_13360 [Chloroflexota bacterium]
MELLQVDRFVGRPGKKELREMKGSSVVPTRADQKHVGPGSNPESCCLGVQNHCARAVMPGQVQVPSEDAQPRATHVL